MCLFYQILFCVVVFVLTGELFHTYRINRKETRLYIIHSSHIYIILLDQESSILLVLSSE